MCNDQVACCAGDIASGKFLSYLARETSRVRLWARRDPLSGLETPVLSVNFADGDSLCVTFGRQEDAVAIADMFIHAKPVAGPPAYPGHCLDPELCAGKGFCPRDISCVD